MITIHIAYLFATVVIIIALITALLTLWIRGCHHYNELVEQYESEKKIKDAYCTRVLSMLTKEKARNHLDKLEIREELLRRIMHVVEKRLVQTPSDAPLNRVYKYLIEQHHSNYVEYHKALETSKGLNDDNKS